MAIKRIISEKQIQGMVEKKKKARIEPADRLSNLPHDLQLRILSSLNTKDAFKLSLSSKTWDSLWNRIPLLEFNYSVYVFGNLHVFDRFVNRVLGLRDKSANLDRLTFNRHGICSGKILDKVFRYAFSHGVKKLEASIVNSRNKTWPVCERSSFDSLTNLKLKSEIGISCPFLGRTFKNLTDLHLEGAIITDPFSGFPVLKKLTLLSCDIDTEGKTLIIHARNLSDLTISGYWSFNCCELKTPRLGFLEYQGPDFPEFRTGDEGLPVLDTVVVSYEDVRKEMQEKRTFDDLLSLFNAISNAKSLRIFPHVVDILSFFRSELVNRSSPFQKLKCLELDVKPRDENWFGGEPAGIPSDVKDFLLWNSPDAKVTMMYP